MYCKLLTKHVLYELNPELGLGNHYKLILFKCKQVTLYERSSKAVTYRGWNIILCLYISWY